MKKYFFTGLALLLPLAVTIGIVVFLVNLLTTPFLGITQTFLEHLNLFQSGFLFLDKEQIIFIFSQILILVILFIGTILLGMLTRWVVVNYFLNLGDGLIQRIPLINTIYKASREMIGGIFSPGKRSFKRVVMVPFPHSDSLGIGFVTHEEVQGPGGKKLIAVFIPTTPNPTSGFLMFFTEDKTIPIDMSVEDALKYTISCGVVSAELKTKQESAYAK